MSAPHMNLRGLDSKSQIELNMRTANYKKLASFMNAEPDEIGMKHMHVNEIRRVLPLP